jgi:hypothetical protein
MKPFLLALAILVVLIVAIVVIGALLPKHHVAQRTAAFNATSEQVFRLISGPQDWRTDLSEYKFYDDAGRHMISETDKRGQRITYEVVESQSPTSFRRAIADKNLPFGGTWTWSIEAHHGGCAVKIEEDGDVYNPVFRFVSRLLMGHTRTIDNYLAMLANAVKQRNAGVPSSMAR